MKCKKCKREIENLKICPYCQAKNIKDTVVKGTSKAIDGVDNEIKNIKWLNDPYSVTTILLIGLLVYMLFVIGYNYVSNLGLLDLIGSSSLFLILTVYFVLLRMKFGKEYFSYMNLIVCILLGINIVGSFFNLLTTFNFTNIFDFIVDGLLFTYFLNSFFYKYVKKIDVLKKMNNKIVFYILSCVLIILYVLLIIKNITTLPIVQIIKYIFELVLLLFFSRYVYLYKQYKEMK